MLIIFLTSIIVFFAILEIIHFQRPFSPLKIHNLKANTSKSHEELSIDIEIEIKNTNKKMEVMIPEFQVEPIILSENYIDSIKITKTISSSHQDPVARKDQYWQAYIVKGLESTFISLNLKLKGKSDQISSIDNIWLDFNWINYGPFGRINRRDGNIIPIKTHIPINSSNAQFSNKEGYSLLPIKTHLLGSIDDLENLIINYCGPIIQEGDIITIGETPLAIIQGRYINPFNITPSILARLLCKAFHPTSSLATACGLQTLINISGPSRVLIAWILGVLTKSIGIKGIFYRFAGEQARLIDDITGTTPPYDQTIVLGPRETKKICEKIAKRFKVEIAIVDVNDLGRVKILASSRNCNNEILYQALKPNPAGNGNEQTPIVLVRPYKINNPRRI